MRYYNLVLNVSKDEIKENINMKLREYRYDDPLIVINNYMYRNIKNKITFFIYREGENVIYAAFSYDEKNEEFRTAYDHIFEILNETFQIKKVVEKPEEVTMFQFLECVLEGRRREYIHAWGNLLETSRLWIYNEGYESVKGLYYNFSEKNNF